MESVGSPLNSRKKYVLWTSDTLQTCQSSIISFWSFLNSDGHFGGLATSIEIGSKPTSFTLFKDGMGFNSGSGTCYTRQRILSNFDLLFLESSNILSKVFTEENEEKLVFHLTFEVPDRFY